MDKNKIYVAIDLGSVSFHFVVMTQKRGRLSWVECKKEIIRLASGLNPKKGTLSPEIEKRALRTLNYFGRHLKNFNVAQCRVVGTSTFRNLKDNEIFQKKAELALGHKIDVLSGEDEARYIYRGVSYNLPKEKRIVIDIGGGSTECVAGNGTTAEIITSIELGCITLTQAYFQDGTINETKFEQAELMAANAFKSIAEPFKDYAWESELGTSGTIKAISWALQNLDISDGTISREAIASLKKEILSCSNTNELSKRIKLNYHRSSVFCGGFVLLSQAFNVLGLSYLKIAQGAIREGIIDEMIEINESNQQRSHQTD